MADEVIDLTISDDEKGPRKGTNSDVSASHKPVRRSQRSRGKNKSQNGVIEAAEDSNIHEASKETRSSQKSDKGRAPNEEPPTSSRSSNGSSTLLSRLGGLLNENKKDNRPKPGGRARGKEKEKSKSVSVQESAPLRQRSRSPSPKPIAEVALAELPVDQLFFIDTGLTAPTNDSEAEVPTPLGTGASTLNEASTRSLKRKRSKEHKRKQETAARTQGIESEPDGAVQVEFVGGDALAVGDTVISTSTTQTTTSITPSTIETADSTRVEIKQAINGVTSITTLALPSHVTLWSEGDPDVSLADVATSALEPEEGVEYVDYEEDKATGVARYFVPDIGTATKKLCRTCGEEGHIAKNCKRLICLTCGERDDHDTRNCPMRVVCFNCGGKGHVISTCPQPRQRGQLGCERCGSLTHIHQRCLDQFKTYIYLSDSERRQVLEDRDKLENIPFGDGGEGYIARHVWCYNCGGPGHWGDECQDPKPYNGPKDPCALSSQNASRGPFGDDSLTSDRDAPRPAWMDDDPHLQDVGRRGKEANMKKNRAAEASRAAREVDEDDWFSRAAGPSSKGNNKHASTSNSAPKPKFSSQPRGNDGRPADGRDRIRERNRDRGRYRDQDRDSDKRKRARDDDNERNYQRRDDDSRRRYEPRDDDRRYRRTRREEDRGGDRRGPQYRGSYS